MKEPSEKSHVVPYGTLVLVWLGLMLLTAMTAVVAGINLGRANVVIALAVASAKVALVGFFFMHLKYENRVFRIIALVAIVTLATIIGVTFVDTAFR